MIAGVDGCKDKWIAVVEMADGRTEIRKPCTFQQLRDDRELDLVVIDVPIGLVDQGARQADALARRFLDRRGCCVFPAPIRPVLACRTWEDACRKRFEVENKKMSKQQFGILSKVAEVDHALRQGNIDRFYEGHPEISFAWMNNKLPISKGKKTSEGKKRRTELVSIHFSDAGARMDDYQHHREDVLDAYALLWTARRIRGGGEETFPGKPDRDKFGLWMKITV
jgi:predicted RNase H-like nuclease